MVRLPRRRFEELVRQALDELPSPIKSRMDNVDIVVQEWPTPSDLDDAGLHSRRELLGLYQGVPLTERSDYTMVLPDIITIFRRPIEARCATAEEVVQEVRVTVVHEVAHHFGISDDALEETAYG